EVLALAPPLRRHGEAGRGCPWFALIPKVPLSSFAGERAKSSRLPPLLQGLPGACRVRWRPCISPDPRGARSHVYPRKKPRRRLVLAEAGDPPRAPKSAGGVRRGCTAGAGRDGAEPGAGCRAGRAGTGRERG